MLLIGVPAGYLVISANQSRDSGKDKEARSRRRASPRAGRRGCSAASRGADPAATRLVAYYETNNWKTSRLYVQFRTSSAGLDRFLSRLGSGRAALTDGDVTVGARDTKIAGWYFGHGVDWAGTTHTNKDPRPTQDITVDMTDPASPVVYVVSAATP